tara:strand:- start:364 stop:558 length:195 start_codon:yes stop_codon:yes gene_type:complete
MISNRYDYILEAVEIAEQLDELNAMRQEDINRRGQSPIEDDLQDWEGIMDLEIKPKSTIGCSLS